MACEALRSEEEEWISATVMGDGAAFAALLERCMPMLRAETAKVRTDLADEDDLAQEAALGLLAAAKAYRADRGASFSTFAAICVRRRLLNVVRNLSTVETPKDDSSLFSELEKDTCGLSFEPDQWVTAREDEKALLERLKTMLSETEYRVLILHLTAYSYEEIARALDMSEKAVDNALQRAKRKLKTAF